MKTEEEIRARIRNLTEMLKYASLIEASGIHREIETLRWVLEETVDLVREE